MLKCYNCGNETRIPTLYKKGLYLCTRCYRFTKLPALVMTKRWYCDMLYNPQTGYYFREGEDVLKQCGFKLYERYVYRARRVSNKYSERLIYRYFGNIGCRLLSEDARSNFRIECKCKTCC